ncbi:unnamed protein product [marine sediment metagenome]|uniref:Uncharacterized protein n=1 Tax=marine sediment metagenome TaxID=412755 RepID=X1KFI4_9ZZZZ
MGRGAQQVKESAPGGWGGVLSVSFSGNIEIISSSRRGFPKGGTTICTPTPILTPKGTANRNRQAN